MHSNWGYLFTLALNLSVLLPLNGNSMVDQYAIALTNAYWVILGIWWCEYLILPFCLFSPSRILPLLLLQDDDPINLERLTLTHIQSYSNRPDQARRSQKDRPI